MSKNITQQRVILTSNASSVRVSEFDEKKTVIHGYVLKHSNHDDPKKSLKLTF